MGKICFPWELRDEWFFFFFFLLGGGGGKKVLSRSFWAPCGMFRSSVSLHLRILQRPSLTWRRRMRSFSRRDVRARYVWRKWNRPLSDWFVTLSWCASCLRRCKHAWRPPPPPRPHPAFWRVSSPVRCQPTSEMEIMLDLKSDLEDKS